MKKEEKNNLREKRREILNDLVPCAGDYYLGTDIRKKRITEALDSLERLDKEGEE